MDTPTLARTLYRLFRRRWIEFRGPPFCPPPKQAIVLDAKEIERELTARGRFSDGPGYSLTPLGGHVWESFASPDWGRFIEDFTTDYVEDEGSGGGSDWNCREVMTADRRMLERYMESVRSEYVVRPDSESVDMRHDWEYCYWKPPRSAYVWRFLAKDRREHRPSPPWVLRDRWCEWR